jgi:dipeptidase E
LQEQQLIEPIRARVEAGLAYLGTSAGSNVACPTIRTTNDMPIVQPASFSALGLVPFQINAHYLDADPKSTHQGETREQRLTEYLEENATPVIALREGAMIRVDGPETKLEGETGAVLFARDQPPRELAPGTLIEAI